MNHSKTFVFVALAVAFAISGCYPSRMTNNYNSLLGSLQTESAIIEESGQDEESEKRIKEELQRLAEEEGTAYRINAGDQIDIRVYGHNDLNIVTRVSPDGSIGMVFVGQLVISGLTISEARDAIERGLQPYVKHPVVGVTVLEVSSETITISGATHKPGLYNISANTRLADAYAMAGGSATRLMFGYDADVADLEHSTLVRDGRILPVNFKEAIENGNKLHNVKLKKGDYIYISQKMDASLTVCGEIRSPQKRPYDPNMGIIEALTICGWMLETHWSHVIIIRDSLSNPKMYKVDIDGILSGRCPNIKLKANDIIYVPKDNISEYNVFVRKLMPTAQLFNLLSSKKVITSF